MMSRLSKWNTKLSEELKQRPTALALVEAEELWDAEANLLQSLLRLHITSNPICLEVAYIRERGVHMISGCP